MPRPEIRTRRSHAPTPWRNTLRFTRLCGCPRFRIGVDGRIAQSTETAHGAVVIRRGFQKPWRCASRSTWRQTGPCAQLEGGETACAVVHAGCFIPFDQGYFAHQDGACDDVEQRDAGQAPGAMVDRAPRRQQRGLHEVETDPGKLQRTVDMDERRHMGAYAFVMRGPSLEMRIGSSATQSTYRRIMLRQWGIGGNIPYWLEKRGEADGRTDRVSAVSSVAGFPRRPARMHLRRHRRGSSRCSSASRRGGWRRPGSLRYARAGPRVLP